MSRKRGNSRQNNRKTNRYGKLALSDDRQRARMLAMHEKQKAVDGDDRPATIADIKALLAGRDKDGRGVNV